MAVAFNSFLIRTRPHPHRKERGESRREIVVTVVARHLGELAQGLPGLSGLAVLIRGRGAHRNSRASSRICRGRQTSRTRSGNNDGLRSREDIEIRRHWKIAGLTAQKRRVKAELGPEFAHLLKLVGPHQPCPSPAPQFTFPTEATRSAVGVRRGASPSG